MERAAGKGRPRLDGAVRGGKECGVVGRGGGEAGRWGGGEASWTGERGK